MQPEILPAPPHFVPEGASLFLDFDGTLVDLIENPDQVVADYSLRNLLLALERKLGGRLAIVSGRSLSQLDAMLGSVAQLIALSGSHGSQHRWRGMTIQPHRPETLDQATARLRIFAADRPDTLIEEKSFGVALHYRKCPGFEEAALDFASEISTELDLYLQVGKLMVELRAHGGDKGAAVRQIMERPPMVGSRPVFIRDDRTDEAAFAVVSEFRGCGILVGPAQPTAATYGLANPSAVRAWLAQCLV